MVDKEISKPGTGDLVELGAESAAGAIGAAIGYFAVGPVGAIVGGAASPPIAHAIIRVANEIKQRYLSPREVQRIATALSFAAEKIKENQSKGQNIRDDGFFTSPANDRSIAEEVAEGILLAAQREYEERKVRYEGNLLANLCFTQSVDRPMANLLIKLFESATYRQLMFLSFLKRLDEMNIPARNDIGQLREDYSIRIARADLVQEAKDLERLGLVKFDFVPYETNFNPRYIKLTDLGQLLYELMELHSVERSELDDFISIFGTKQR